MVKHLCALVREEMEFGVQFLQKRMSRWQAYVYKKQLFGATQCNL